MHLAGKAAWSGEMRTAGHLRAMLRLNGGRRRRGGMFASNPAIIKAEQRKAAVRRATSPTWGYRVELQHANRKNDKLRAELIFYKETADEHMHCHQNRVPGPETLFAPPLAESLMDGTTAAEWAALTGDLGIPGLTAPHYSCRFNNKILTYDATIKEIGEALQNFFHDNDTPSIPISQLWETLKAYLRGMFITILSHLNQYKEKYTLLEDRIQDSHRQSGTHRVRQQLTLARKQLKALDLDKADKAKILHCGNNADRLLVHKLQAQTHRTRIVDIYPDKRWYFFHS
ncbi:hypothetical protein NDU88_002224 [Pleurodeles waltl]|uniref:Uncharacterized protein n=1 Tax=Pleurodeles waltl TaxID=8319 RepID=A0AAV7NEU0_PLEWA|nr:hypothetical protein NDU88_002224 [Pleurodeles waltl]